MGKIWMLVPTLGLIWTTAALGATLLETRDEEGATEQIYFEGNRMRAQEAGSDEYVLVDAAARKMYMVNPQERQVIDMSGVLSDHPGTAAGGGGPEPRVELVKEGAGPEVAGYPTEHYVVRVDGRKCSDEYLSRKALADLGAGTFIALMADLEAGSQMGEGEEWRDPCDRAEGTLEKRYAETGIPLRVVEPDGKVSTEVLRIVPGASLPPGGFSIPDGYAVVDFRAMMQRAFRPAGAGGEPGGMDPSELQKLMEQMMKQQGQ